MQKDTIIWALLCVIVGVITILYLSVAVVEGAGGPIMPLDDTYIHFQYARQMAAGHPFSYNTGDAPTSGSTSLIYMPLLAAGYMLGFKELALGYWAMALGIAAYVGSAWLIYLSVRESGGSRLLSSLMMFTFVLNGAFIWSALSGMETLLFVFAVLLCLCAYQRGGQRKAALAGVLVALVRPEGAVVAGTLAVALVWRHWKTHRTVALWSAWPVLAIGAQPLVNLLVTGTLTATGNEAKSELYDVSSPWSERVSRVLDHWLRMWREFFEGRALYGDPYIPGLVFALALVIVLWSVKHSRDKRAIHPALLAGVWMVLLSTGVATLETAFWHYKRYQLPIMALAVPLAGWLLAAASQRVTYRWIVTALGGLIMIFSAHTNTVFLPLYHNNVVVTAHFQYQVAQWIADHLPDDARIAVFDVGITRYVGGRYTYDIVGLTTPDIVSAYRQGPGAVFDTMAAHPQRPQYAALYPIAAHPTTIYMMQTAVWSDELAHFTAPDLDNTTSAGQAQVIAALDWSAVEDSGHVRQFQLPAGYDDLRLVGTLNTGDLFSERAVDYTWENHTKVPGFLSTLEQLPYYHCEGALCSVVDGVRGINGAERFELPAVGPGEDYLVVMRAYARESARLDYGCGHTLGSLAVPQVAGNWVDIAFLVPGTQRELCISAHGTYYPARYWLYTGEHTPVIFDGTPLAQWPGIALLEHSMTHTADALALRLSWYVAPDSAQQLQGDGKLFVHLYAPDGLDQPPLAQWDGYLRTVTPLANLLPGQFDEDITLPLTGIPPGTYRVGIGFYNQQSGQRYPLRSGTADNDGTRVFLPAVVIGAGD